MIAASTTGKFTRSEATDATSGPSTGGTLPDGRTNTGRPVNNATPGAVATPKISAPLLSWFTWYSRRYLGRHFHTVRISLAGLPPNPRGLPLILYSNHASWWDALVCLVLKDEFFPDRNAFAPIDATMLEKYRFFKSLGFFGVEQGTRRGAVQFLRTAESVLSRCNTILAMTPQGRFADPRERPVRFAPGLGHLAARVPAAMFVPLAGEYVFWEERLPEIVVRFGPPVEIRRQHQAPTHARFWTQLFENSLARTQDALAAEVLRRNPTDFRVLLRGGAGQGGVYDWWRLAKAKLRGQPFLKEHGDK